MWGTERLEAHAAFNRCMQSTLASTLGLNASIWSIQIKNYDKLRDLLIWSLSVWRNDDKRDI